MVMDIEKIHLVKELARAMAKLSLGDANLFMRQANLFDIPNQAWVDYSQGANRVTLEEREDFVKPRLHELELDELRELLEAVNSFHGDSASLPVSDSESRPLYLFASHLSAEKALVQQVAELLARRGIELFVAHESIRPSEDWQNKIEAALANCHGAIAFIHPDFSASDWCHQEMGWIRGRGVPFLPLLFEGELPKGLLAKTHGKKVSNKVDAQEIADLIHEWALQFTEFQAPMRLSTVQAFSQSKSFNSTDKLWSQLSKFTNFTDKEISILLEALENNSQIYGALCKTTRNDKNYGRPYPDVVLEFLSSEARFNKHGANVKQDTE